MTPESRKKHFWTERAGYKGRESFTGALMSHRADTQHPPSAPTNSPILGHGSPRSYTSPFSVCLVFTQDSVKETPSQSVLLLPSPFSRFSCTGTNCGFTFAQERESTHFSDCLPQCLSLATLLYGTHGARLWSVSKIPAL